MSASTVAPHLLACLSDPWWHVQPAEHPPCQTEACTLQTCLSRHTYSPAKCDPQMLELYRCCAKMYSQEGGDGSGKRTGKGEGGTEGSGSTACPIKSVVERKLKQMESS